MTDLSDVDPDMHDLLLCLKSLTLRIQSERREITRDCKASPSPDMMTTGAPPCTSSP